MVDFNMLCSDVKDWFVTITAEILSQYNGIGAVMDMWYWCIRSKNCLGFNDPIFEPVIIKRWGRVEMLGWGE